MRFKIALPIALMLWSTPLVSLADSSTPPLTFTLTAETGDRIDVDRVRSCSIKALSPRLLIAPEFCGVGRWLPEPAYLDLYSWAIRGKDCQADIESAKRKTLTAAALGVDSAERKSRVLKLALDDCEAHRSPSPIKRVLFVGAGGLAGAGVGTAGGAVAAAFSDLDWDQGLGGGAVLGFVSGIVSALIVDQLRQ